MIDLDRLVKALNTQAITRKRKDVPDDAYIFLNAVITIGSEHGAKTPYSFSLPEGYHSILRRGTRRYEFLQNSQLLEVRPGARFETTLISQWEHDGTSVYAAAGEHMVARIKNIDRYAIVWGGKRLFVDR